MVHLNKAVSISLPKYLIAEIEDLRGERTRSLIYLKLIQKGLKAYKKELFK